MKWFTFRQGVVWILLLLGIPTMVYGGEAWYEEYDEEEWEMMYENKIRRYRRGWANLIPQYQKMQYAGSMGVVSLGVGWDYGKKEQWETDLFFGYLPRFKGDRGYLTMTLKENYIPWMVKVRQKDVQIEPLTVSLYVNKIFGDEFWSSEPDKYPSGYYGLATNLRFNLAFGQRIQLKTKPIGIVNRITCFYEFSTSDLYLISFFTNKYLHLSDIFHFSFGIKLKFI
jgi:hypothetical protein